MRPQFGAMGKAVGHNTVSFVSQSAADAGLGEALGLSKPVEAVKNCPGIGKADMKLNDALPSIEVDPETYKVTADGEFLECAPAEVLPLAQKYFLF